MKERVNSVGKQKRLLAMLTSLTLTLSIAAPAMAVNPASSLASTGQTLSIEITGPADGSRVNVPPGTVTATGTTSIGPLSNSGNVMYVVDVSGSTLSPMNQDCNGDHVVNALDDVNGDGYRGTTLDCEIAGAVALNSSLAGSPGASAGLIAFGQTAAIADVDPTGGQQNFTSPLSADKNGAGGPDMEQVARSLRAGLVNLFTVKNVGQSTNYNATLIQLASAFIGKAGQHNIAFFMSDGQPTPGTFTTGAGTPLAQVAAAGIKVNTYSVGAAGAGCGASSALKIIANVTGGTCTVVSDPSQLSSILIQPATITKVEVSLNGGAPVLASLAGGIWSMPLTGLQGGVWNVIRATVTASEGSTATADVQVYGNRAPAADAGSPVMIDEGSSVVLSGTATDPDGDTLTVSWATSAHLTGADTASPTFTADDDMTETLTMTVSDPGGLTASSSTAVTVRNVAPTATLSVSTPVNEADPVMVSLAGAHDPSAADTAAGFHYAFDCNGGDLSGAAYATAGTSPATTCSYDDGPSTQVVKGRIIDKDGGWNEYSATVSVTNVAPVANLGNTGPVDEGTPVTMGFTGQYDPSAADTAAGFHYDLGCSGAAFGPADYAASGTADSTACTFDDGNSTHMLRGRIIDKDGGFSEYTTTVSVSNVAPTAVLSNSGPVNEGGAVAVSFGGQYDPSAADTAAGFHYAFACDGADISSADYASSGSADSAACTFDDGPRTYMVRARIIDKDGGYSEYTTAVDVNNVAPTASLGNSGPVDEGSPVAVSFAAQYDPSAADSAAGFHYAFACDGGDLSTATYASGGASETAACTFDDGPGSYVVHGRIIDKDGGYSEYATTVNVSNVPPTAMLAVPGPVDEGSPFALALINPQDPSEADTMAGFTVSFDCGDGAGYHSSADCTAIDNPSQTVTARIADKDGGYTEYTATVAVKNVAPTVGAIMAPLDPIRVGVAVSTTAAFTDPGVMDTHTAVWDWGDGTTSAGTVAETNGSGQVGGSHAYTAAGIYTVTVTMTDKDGGAGTATFRYLVVYDPDGGFVTGGGWIDSPPGAYAPDPTMTGRANFGFVSKYQRGASVPTGQTEFQFKAGTLNFHSTAYQWLVIAGARAQYKGTGTINGTGSYGFMLTAIDGQVNGGGGVDKFRIKIWDAATGGVIYDNQMGAGEEATPSTAISGGSIVIHS
jgi:hypothetical protein